jgi:iron-sulfur cluster assembly accessory protein
MIELTERAIQKINALASAASPEQRLRLFISEGGCSGMEYGMKFDLPVDGDLRFGDARCEIIVDPASLEKINGSSLDFDDGLHGTGFSVKNPKAVETCGCGRSFS